MPAFEGLLPLRDDQIVADMLFELANWHALARLRLHTDVTINILERATRYMYKAIRTFANKTCARHETYETSNEAQKRMRRDKGKSKSKIRLVNGRKRVHYNVMNTYKYHALGYYPDYIRRSGSTDNYTTQVVCSLCFLQHAVCV